MLLLRRIKTDAEEPLSTNVSIIDEEASPPCKRSTVAVQRTACSISDCDRKRQKMGQSGWEERFQALMAYKRHHGHLRVTEPQNPLLHSWIKTQ
jgi:hypothetical protein